MRLYYDADLDLELIKTKLVAIIGYGNQGHAHAQNLKDSGVRTIVGLRPESPRAADARGAGLEVRSVPDAARAADVIMIVAPDEQQGALFAADVAPAIGDGSGKALAFAHGFAVHFGQIVAPPRADVIMAAPMGAGHMLRREFLRGGGVPCLIAVAQDASGRAKDLALSYAGALGGGRAGILETTFREECETDLFAEQAVLCGGLTALMRTAFEVLVDAGYGPEMAYFSCVHELRFIVDLIQKRGLAGMRDAISNTARYGDLTRGPRIIDETARERLKGVLRDIQSGDFAREWITEHNAGKPRFQALDRAAHEHPIEEVGARLRKMMSWMDDEER